LEALACEPTLSADDAQAYSFATTTPSSWPGSGRPSMFSLRAADKDVDGRRMAGHDEGAPLVLDPAPMWRALLGDLERGVSHGTIAARFHQGLAIALVAVARALTRRARFDTVALSGGCLQNAVLLEQTERRLHEAGFAVLTHRTVPANDGGLALGQAAVAAARLMA